MSAATVMKMMKDNDVKYVDMRFTDTIGKEQHVTIPASTVKANFFKDGKMFDGSSILPSLKKLAFTVLAGIVTC